MPDNSSRTLVTGGTGFVGSHLVDRLIEDGRSVRCLVRGSSNLRYLKHPEIEFAYGGLEPSTDWDAVLDGVDTVYHVAGLPYAKRRSDYYLVNHRGTEAILAAAIKHRAHLKRFVLISSLAAIGPGRDGVPVHEGTEAAPITPYGRSKLLGEEAVKAVGDLLPYTIVRPPAVYGPRDYALFEFFKEVARGRSPMIGRDDKRISLVHVRDLVNGIILAGESDNAMGRAYFISSEEIYSWHEVAALLARVMGKQTRTIAIPRSIAYGVALAAEAAAAFSSKPPVINRDKVTDLSQKCWACSVDRARDELGYRQQVNLEEGFRETLAWYKSEGWL
ncbi:MAG TPA: NAD-dependent epimerase/dehydratase family protein [Blastocatellia bacterium]|nr:NAD-dependent epimerase/dehydratase family protein [Blastocatellia bacterium]